MDIIRKLTPADYVSFTGLFAAFLSSILLIADMPRQAIFLSLAAFLLDITDGFIARKLKQVSKLGREIDSFADIFIYLVFSSILFIKYLSPEIISGILAGYLIILFGGLRLIRFNNEGILKDREILYYRGITVVHVYILTLILYFSEKITNRSLSLISLPLILMICPAMLSDFKSRKFKNPAYLFIIILLFIILNTTY